MKSIIKSIIVLLLAAPILSCQFFQVGYEVTIFNETGNTITDIYLMPLKDYVNVGNDKSYSEWLNHYSQDMESEIDEYYKIDMNPLEHASSTFGDLEYVDQYADTFKLVAFDSNNIYVKEFGAYDEKVYIMSTDNILDKISSHSM